MKAYIPTKEDLEEIVSRVTKRTVKEVLPEAIREATRREWLRTEEVMEMLQCSRRHVQYLRDSKQLPYTQNGRTIRYHIEDVEEFLNQHKVEPKEESNGST